MRLKDIIYFVIYVFQKNIGDNYIYSHNDKKVFTFGEENNIKFLNIIYENTDISIKLDLLDKREFVNISLTLVDFNKYYECSNFNDKEKKNYWIAKKYIDERSLFDEESIRINDDFQEELFPNVTDNRLERLSNKLFTFNLSYLFIIKL